MSVLSPPFIDKVALQVEGGRGGKGCESFERRFRSRARRPNGGDGGEGGNVLLVVSSDCHTLLDFYYKHHFKAERGSGGGSNQKRGKKGTDLALKVPPGTIVMEAESGIRLRDLRTIGQWLVVAKGGAGGKGNAGGKTPTEGEPGESRTLVLELQVIADVGLIGFPNVGKSSLLTLISNAHPKVAPYPFTTKNPQLGVVEDKKSSRRLVCVEIPGLIEGAHEGKGLGHVFLRHLGRATTLVHLIDMASEEGRDPVQDYDSLNEELRRYNPEFIKKPQLLVANKMDLPGATEQLTRFRKKVRRKIIPISAQTGKGIPELLDSLFSRMVRTSGIVVS